MCIYWLYTKGFITMQSFYSFKSALSMGSSFQEEGFKITRQLNNEEADVFISGNWRD